MNKIQNAVKSILEGADIRTTLLKEGTPWSKYKIDSDDPKFSLRVREAENKYLAGCADDLMAEISALPIGNFIKSLGVASDYAQHAIVLVIKTKDDVTPFQNLNNKLIRELRSKFFNFKTVKDFFRAFPGVQPYEKKNNNNPGHADPMRNEITLRFRLNWPIDTNKVDG